MFVDRAKIIIRSGRGGNGAVSFRREPFVPEGGPDGGDGGDGGNVIFAVDSHMRTLMDFRFRQIYEAEDGQNGMKKKCFGRKGADLVIRVPRGTMVYDSESGLLMHDLKEYGDSFIAAKGGKGGKGNTHFKTSVRQAPKFAEAGTPGKEREVVLELKLIADVGLVGFPNVGKSSILAVSTKARPKIDNYHFTTVDPNLGVVRTGESSFVLADIAGIIEGAHKGAGLGLRFLKHIERTRLLIHVVDVSGSEGRDPIEDYDKIRAELSAYSDKVAAKPMLVAANKCDLIEPGSDILQSFTGHAEAAGTRVFPVCAATGEGVGELMQACAALLASLPEETEQAEMFDFDAGEERGPEYREVRARRDGEVFVLEGRQLQKIVDSTNFNDMGSLRYLYKYIEKSGALDRLRGLGLGEGDTVRIGGTEFEYYDEY